MGKYSGLSTSEIIESMDREREVFISRGQFAFCLASWIISIIAVPCACYWPKTQLYIALGVFALTIGAAAAIGLFKNKFPYKLEKPHGFLEILNTIVYYVSIVVFIVSFFISIMSGGSPKVVEGGYALVEHGKVIKELEYNEYLFYSVVRGAMLTLLTFFNCIQLGFVTKNMRDQ